MPARRRVTLLAALLLVLAGLAGCTPEPATPPGAVRPVPAIPSVPATDAGSPGEEPRSMVDTSDGIDRPEAAVLGLAYFREWLRAREDDASYDPARAGQWKAGTPKPDAGIWYVTYARQYPKGQMGIPLSVTLSIDASDGTLQDTQVAQ